MLSTEDVFDGGELIQTKNGSRGKGRNHMDERDKW